jgi:hypothetical protein
MNLIFIYFFKLCTNLEVVVDTIFNKLQWIVSLEIKGFWVCLHAVVAQWRAGFIFHDMRRLVLVAEQNPAHQHRPGAGGALTVGMQFALASEAAQCILGALGREVGKVNTCNILSLSCTH